MHITSAIEQLLCAWCIHVNNMMLDTCLTYALYLLYSCLTNA